MSDRVYPVSDAPQLSVVIPVFNEAGNILPLAGALVAALAPLNRPFEIIFVNDGSTDGTSVEIDSAHAEWNECVELRLPQNQGQASALLAGLRAARGQFLVTLDGDGQNDPHDIPALLALVESGQVDLACGWRVDRHDSTLRRIMSRIANAVRGAILRDGVHDAGCQLRVFRREVVEALFPTYLMQSFLPAIVAHAGFRIGEIPVRHHARQRGDSKYGFRQLWLRPAIAMFKLRGELRRRKKAATAPNT